MLLGAKHKLSDFKARRRPRAWAPDFSGLSQVSHKRHTARGIIFFWFALHSSYLYLLLTILLTFLSLSCDLTANIKPLKL